jgi:FAD/FMN-containing dehydrogenase
MARTCPDEETFMSINNGAMERRSFLRASAGAVALAGLTGRPARTSAARGPDWDRLRRELSGDLVLPSDSGYPQAKQVYWTEFNSASPPAVAYCQTTPDVSRCVTFARESGLRAIPRSGGHSIAGYSTGDGIVVDVSRLNSMSLSEHAATVGAGAEQIDVMAALSPHGVALPSGVQGGGIGWQTRKSGMACDSLVAAEVVLADGRVVTCSEQAEQPLFWALRGGGGGNFGIVTKYVMAPQPVATMSNFTLTWPWEDAARVFSGWQQWSVSSPDDLVSGPVFELPDAAPGNVPAVVMLGAWQGKPADLNGLLDELVAAIGATPAVRSVTPLSYHDAMLQWYGCSDITVQECHLAGTNPVAKVPRFPFILDRSRLFSQPISESGINAILTAFDANRKAGHVRELRLIALGGKVNAIARDATAYVHRDSQFTVIFINGLQNSLPSPDDVAAARTWVDNGFATIDPYSNGESYQNFIDPALSDWRQSYYAENYPRLVRIKQHYDPDNFFHFAQSIGARPQ